MDRPERAGRPRAGRACLRHRGARQLPGHAADSRYLRDRLVEQAAELEELRRFRELAVSRLAFQHDEIRARRTAAARGVELRRRPPLPALE
ncbi:hypothetical protein [Saccharothrix xinjiangensis]|uniref:Uncharacterized protein n=1 Tax=Saccharothrix xinjiangensis TaxID=204798 RepID=A0ABV9Y341_9PSEU